MSVSKAKQIDRDLLQKQWNQQTEEEVLENSLDVA